ncbi:MAG TPA: glycerol-3-phosphate 1-O-acyltransferase PlsY [Candidatus Acidoferrales bacterium]|nr:glycerol-3-phosphate 1-O-acyltransferase PlsY [Candidatus Acidoferrales bacterium]
MNSLWLLPLAGYLIGSIPFGYLIVRAAKGTDVRASGSGNIGATNVNRVAGAGAGVATLLLDIAKGYLAVWLANRVTGGDISWMAITGLAAVVGHLFPVWLRFHGGKGVATALGVFVPLCWMAVAAAAVVWVVVVSIWRYVSLGSVVAAALLPVCTYLLYAPGTHHAPPLSVSYSTAIVSILVIVKHRENIRRLLAGTENRLKAGGR